MILFAEYRADLLDHIRDEDPALFKSRGLDPDTLIADRDVIDQLWVLYQKATDEYRVPPYRAFRQAVHEVLDIPEPDAYDDGYGGNVKLMF